MTTPTLGDQANSMSTELSMMASLTLNRYGSSDTAKLAEFDLFDDLMSLRHQWLELAEAFDPTCAVPF